MCAFLGLSDIAAWERPVFQIHGHRFVCLLCSVHIPPPLMRAVMLLYGPNSFVVTPLFISRSSRHINYMEHLAILEEQYTSICIPSIIQCCSWTPCH